MSNTVEVKNCTLYLSKDTIMWAKVGPRRWNVVIKRDAWLFEATEAETAAWLAKAHAEVIAGCDA